MFYIKTGVTTFLWIATNAVIAWFGGKQFYTFTEKDELPDDEMLVIVKENLPPGKKVFGRIIKLFYESGLSNYKNKNACN